MGFAIDSIKHIDIEVLLGLSYLVALHLIVNDDHTTAYQLNIKFSTGFVLT